MLESCGSCVLNDGKPEIWIVDLQLVHCPVCELNTCDVQTLNARHIELFLSEGYQDGSWEYDLIGIQEVKKHVDGASGAIFDVKHLKQSSTSGGSSTGFQVFRIICVSIVVPTMTMAVGIACFACLKDRSNNCARTAVAALPEQEATVVINGLDQTTIESYEKLVLGESWRLPGPNDTICAICLSEYLTKDAVRCIPECKHCFHAECVDEWPRMNSTCPVCPNNPSPAHVVDVNSNQV